MHRFFLVSILCFVLISISVSADIPQMINYQGKVTDTSGDPVPDGTYIMQFEIFDAPTGNILLWSSGDVSLDVTDGIFSVLLGQSPQPLLDLEFDQDCWLEVVVESVIQSPRQRLVSVACAYMASGLVAGTEVIGEVTTEPYAAIKGTNTGTLGVNYGVFGMTASTSSSAAGVYGEAPMMGVSGVCHSLGGIGVKGDVTATEGLSYGVIGRSCSTGGVGVFGYVPANTGENWGIQGVSLSTDGTGVYGLAWAASGETYGIYGENGSTSGHGVYGFATATSGHTYGGQFQSDSGSGCGVRGNATATSGYTYGVYGQSASTAGFGVYGTATATSGHTYGVYGESSSNAGRGVRGRATASSGVTYGGRFENSSSSGLAVYGTAISTAGITYGVYGESISTDGYGVYYSGGLAGTGTKSCVVKTSQGPTLMYCQESPENWFEDFGEGQLVDGRCRIELDPLFLETVTIDETNPMKVFVEHRGPCQGTYIETGETGFTVIEQNSGTSDVGFCYRVVAKRKGFESNRLDYCKAAETDSYLYPELREKELKELEAVRMRNDSISP